MAIGISQIGTNLIGTNLIGIKSLFQNGKSQKTAKMANGITNGTINGTMHQTINGITNGKMVQIGMKSHMMVQTVHGLDLMMNLMMKIMDGEWNEEMEETQEIEDGAVHHVDGVVMAVMAVMAADTVAMEVDMA